MQLSKGNINKMILVIAPSRQTRGGITSVVRAYSSTAFWNQLNCKWIETYIDRNNIYKILFFLKGFIHYIILLPFASIVHIHLSEPISAIRKTFFFIPALLLNKKIILHFHSFSPEITYLGKYKKVYKFLFSNCDALIVLSASCEKNIIEMLQINKSKINVLYNPCPEIVQRTNTLISSKYILFIGTLTKRKGYHDLINAFQKVSNIYPEWKLILAGNGEIDKANILADKLNISDKVTCLDWITDSEKDNVFRNASIFCLPSYVEGLPMAIMDALAYGLPVVTTPVGGIPDVFSHMKNAIFIEPGNIEEISEALLMLIRSEKLAEQLKAESLFLKENLFDLNKITQKLNLIYLQIIKSKKHATVTV
jgi:glycosyltransferase involved in cell wall biosynthesis